MNEVIFIVTVSLVWGWFIWYMSRIPPVSDSEHKKKSQKPRINE